MAELSIDAHQANRESLHDLAARIVSETPNDTEEGTGLSLEGFGPFRSSMVWKFNHLYWQHLNAWGKASGRCYEHGSPQEESDGNHPLAIADSVTGFWNLLQNLEAHAQLPSEIYVLEIGVGAGSRAAMWLDRFRALDQEHGTGCYSRIRFLLADYSVSALDRSREAVKGHIDLCSFLALDALNPIKSLSFLRSRVLYIHLKNVYGNLPDDELVRRNGRLYFVQVRAYLRGAELRDISKSFDVPISEIPATVNRLLEIGPIYFADVARGVGFWQAVWKAIRLEERRVLLDNTQDALFVSGLAEGQLKAILSDAPSDFRFGLSSGALESFKNTLPLLHVRGYLEVQDNFVTNFCECQHGFPRPRKLDGAMVSWVNGVLMRELGRQAGYNVRFAPFSHRRKSKTSILYATHRDSHSNDF